MLKILVYSFLFLVMSFGEFRTNQHDPHRIMLQTSLSILWDSLKKLPSSVCYFMLSTSMHVLPLCVQMHHMRAWCPQRLERNMGSSEN